ncbi:MAG: glycosyltransferase family 4 protein [Bacteroidales bacterium]|nr:glycosyltransferase family 4 protein [Bacteroidales bacterium]
MKAKKSVLYITTDGLTDPLGQSQILPYLQGLSKEYRIHILSCEKPEVYLQRAVVIQERVDKAGIQWHTVNFRNSPPVLGSWLMQRELRKKAKAIIKDNNISMLHCRSYPAGMIGMALGHKYDLPWLFDMRGFWPDERKDRHIWDLKNPLFLMVYKWFKHKEKQLFASASHIISLTWKAKEILIMSFGVIEDKISVIPCASDSGHFYKRNANTALKASLGFQPEHKILAYSGSLGSCYLLDEMLMFFKAGLNINPRLRMVFLSPKTYHEMVMERAAQLGLKPELVKCAFFSREEMPEALSIVDYGVMFFEPSFSIQASSPTKHGEFLSMHIPVVTNAGVGDMERILAEKPTGVIVHDFSEKEMLKAWQALVENNYLSEDFDDQAKKWYDLERGIDKYSDIYKLNV